MDMFTELFKKFHVPASPNQLATFQNIPNKTFTDLSLCIQSNYVTRSAFAEIYLPPAPQRPDSLTANHVASSHHNDSLPFVEKCNRQE